MQLTEPADAQSAPQRPMRVLHLEDNTEDRELVRHAFQEAGLACEFVYASSKTEFDAALGRGTYDLILSDFSIPGYDGSTALAIAREKCPAVPYLFVSGTIGEERAIESLKNGATDYVLKNRLERLLPAVQRALRESGERARRKAAEEALRQAEARFRSIFENAVEGIYQSTPAGRLIDANRAMARLCGYASPAELCASLRSLDSDLYVDAEKRAEFVRRLDAEGEVFGHESQIRRKDGTTIWISDNAR
ncbi:MAG TPA: response regulator, partial [Opitutus sp.]|nr:response regulator [Opitutus sp.]